MTDPYALKLYIDGCAYENPGGPGGLACIAEYPESWNRPDEEVFRIGYAETTNNRMELLALIRALQYVRDEGEALGVSRVVILTDSLYVNDNHRRAPTWRDNDWKNAAGRPIENRDLWREFLSVRGKVRVRTDIMWKKGKKSPILKAVDKAAKTAGKEPFQVDRGFRGGKVGRSKTTGASSMFAANGQQVAIRVYRSRLLGKQDHKIYFEVYSESLKEFIQKCFAYAEQSIAADLHRGHLYRVCFNHNPRYPLIAAIVEEINLPNRAVDDGTHRQS